MEVRPVVRCPGCDGVIPPEKWQLGDILSCPECGVELEVINLEPCELALAPQEEEDWGQ